jgi:TolB-like protein
MKRILTLILLCAAGLGFAQETENLDTSLARAGDYIASRLSAGTRLMVLPFVAPTRELGDYLTDELSGRLVNGGTFTVVERSPEVLKSLDTEVFYQNMGEVSDETAQAIGKKSGAEVVISGTLSRAGDLYRISVKILNVEKAEILGQRGSLLRMDSILAGLLEAPQTPAASSGENPSGRPGWIASPLEYGRAAYEKERTGMSPWYYAVGVSTKTSNEQRARTRARENVQSDVAAVIASDFRARIDITENSLFTDMDIENAARTVETAITNSIRTRIPPFEPLAWHIESGKEVNGQVWYMAYFLVRFSRGDIVGIVEKIDPLRVTENLIRQAKLPSADAEAKEELVRELAEAREYVVERMKSGDE